MAQAPGRANTNRAVARAVTCRPKQQNVKKVHDDLGFYGARPTKGKERRYKGKAL